MLLSTHHSQVIAALVIIVDIIVLVFEYAKVGDRIFTILGGPNHAAFVVPRKA